LDNAGSATAEETGNTISILSDDYRRYVTLNGRRTRIAIPEPRSDYIEMRGEVTEDGKYFYFDPFRDTANRFAAHVACANRKNPGCCR